MPRSLICQRLRESQASLFVSSHSPEGVCCGKSVRARQLDPRAAERTRKFLQARDQSPPGSSASLRFRNHQNCYPGLRRKSLKDDRDAQAADANNVACSLSDKDAGTPFVVLKPLWNVSERSGRIAEDDKQRAYCLRVVNESGPNREGDFSITGHRELILTSLWKAHPVTEG